MQRIPLLKTRINELLKSSSGTVAALTAIILAVFIGFIGLILDIGRLALVKTELQRAADAGALAGARALVPYITNEGEVSSIQWENGIQKARSTVLANKADGKALTDCTVEVGYWNLTNQNLEPIGIIPTVQHLPAVRVTVSKTEGQNNGPVNYFLGGFMGQESSDVTVRAISATIGGVVSVAEGGAFPIAIKEEVVNNYFNELVRLYNNNAPGQDNQTYGLPKGYWTVFKNNNNSNADIKNWIKGTELSPPLEIGETINLAPGQRDVNLHDNIIGGRKGTTLLLPVIPNNTSAGQDNVPILGFVAFELTNYQRGGNSGYVEGYLRKHYGAPGTRAAANAPNYWVYTGTPKLVH